MEEIWKDIPEYEGLYQASTHGRIKSLKRFIKNCRFSNVETILTPVINLKGYCQVTLYLNGAIKNFRLHRLIAITFLEQPKEGKTQINHINGIKTDNRVENLEWCTPKENTAHAYEIGLRMRRTQAKTKSKKTKRKLTKTDISLIRFYKGMMSAKDLASIFGICESNFNMIVRGARWKTTPPFFNNLK